MTPSQQKTVDQLRSEIVRLHNLGQAAKYEFKKFEVIEQGNLVFVVAEYGRIGDEGTMAGLVCRVGPATRSGSAASSRP